MASLDIPAPVAPGASAPGRTVASRTRD
jgi:hypothetical protein